MVKNRFISDICLFLLCFTLSAQPRPGSFRQTWEKGPEWLKDAVIYQIYPSSFKDSDGDGYGDFQGIISKLDYLEDLGVSAIWLNPVFASGWQDGGYDIIDFYRTDPRFGDTEKMEELVRKAHEKGMKVILDLVAGHTSIQHPWFQESGTDKDSPHADYYIWSDRLPDEKAEEDFRELMKNPEEGIQGNWMKSPFPRARYYYKNFLPSQPALNYGFAHPDPSRPWEQAVDAPGPKAVKEEMKRIISFWYGKGIDGFRVDMAASLIKNDTDKEAVIAFWREIRSWSDKNWPGRILMAEWGQPKYCLAAGFHVDMFLNNAGRKARRMYFDKRYLADGGAYFSLNGGKPAKKDLYGRKYPRKERVKIRPADMCKTWMDDYTDCLAWTKDWGYYAMITDNHDNLRFNTGRRNSPDQLKVMMAWIMTMQLPILYYGDEIGIRSLAGIPPVEGSTYYESQDEGIERGMARTPMQWDRTANAGFSSAPEGKIYLPVCPDWTPATTYPDYLKWKAEGKKKATAKGSITVESQTGDPNSLLNWTRSLIRLRKSNQAFWADSQFVPVWKESRPYPLAYLRYDRNDNAFLIVLNPTGKKQRTCVCLPEDIHAEGKQTPLLHTGNGTVDVSSGRMKITMGPVSVWIGKLN